MSELLAALVIGLVAVLGGLVALHGRFRVALLEGLDRPRSYVGWSALWSGIGAALLVPAWYLRTWPWVLPIVLPCLALGLWAAWRTSRRLVPAWLLVHTLLVAAGIAAMPRWPDPSEASRASAAAHAAVARMRAESLDCRAGRAQCDEFTRGDVDRW